MEIEMPLFGNAMTMENNTTAVRRAMVRENDCVDCLPAAITTVTAMVSEKWAVGGRLRRKWRWR